MVMRQLVLSTTPYDWDPCHGNPDPLKFREEFSDAQALLDAVNDQRLHCFEVMQEGISAWDPIKCPNAAITGCPKGHPLVHPDETDKVAVCREVLEDTDHTPLQEAMDNLAARKLVEPYEVPLRQCLLHENTKTMTVAQRVSISAEAAEAVQGVCLPCLRAGMLRECAYDSVLKLWAQGDRT